MTPSTTSWPWNRPMRLPSRRQDPVAMAAYVAENVLTHRMQPLYWRELRDADPSAVTLLDVRTELEFGLGSLPGAVNIPLDDLRNRLDELPADKPIFVFCGVGLRGYLLLQHFAAQRFHRCAQPCRRTESLQGSHCHVARTRPLCLLCAGSEVRTAHSSGSDAARCTPRIAPSRCLRTFLSGTNHETQKQTRQHGARSKS